MSSAKIAITIEKDLLNRVDVLVKARVFPNRSQALQTAVAEKLKRLERSRLAEQCAKLDAKEEQSLAEEGLGFEVSEWPEY
jgi:metal-responsive CopG/Arc/MetJ family transcriptional regulator